MTGAFAPRILRFDGPYGPKGGSGAMGPLRGPGSEGSKGSARLQRAGSEGCGVALSSDEFYNFASRNKNHTTGLRPWEMHPFCLRHLSTGKRLTRFSVAYGSLRIVFACHPGGGGLLSASLSANLSHSLLSAAKTSPSGGSTAAGGDRGAFPMPTGRLYGFSAADRRHLYWRPRGANLHLPFTIFPKLLRRLMSDCLPSFHRPVFIIIFPTYYSYRDPSLALRMTVDGGKAPAPSDV